MPRGRTQISCPLPPPDEQKLLKQNPVNCPEHTQKEHGEERNWNDGRHGWTHAGDMRHRLSKVRRPSLHFASTLRLLEHCGRNRLMGRAEAARPEKLMSYAALTAIVFADFCASALLGSVTVSTPLLNAASIFSASTVSGAWKERSKEP
jgi:hypothetical protein